MNRYIMFIEFVAAAIIILCGLEVGGAVAFSLLIAVTLIFCNDVLAALMPLCLTSVFLTKCYDSADIFLEYSWVALPVILAVVIHFVAYRQKIIIGPNFWGLIAVSVALTFGGLGTITKEEYWNFTSLFYVIALGIGAVISYLWLTALINERHDYDIYGKFAGIIYAMGAFACFAVISYYLSVERTPGDMFVLTEFQASNNLATFLMISMPFAVWHSLKRKRHLLGFILIYACIILSGSRGGLIMGTVEFLICLIYLAVAEKENRFTYICITFFTTVLIYANVQRLLDFYMIASPGELISQNEARFSLLQRMLEDFRANIFFGRGIGYSGNLDVYNPVKGAMHWYHMMIPQVIGSLGLLGILAYAFQFVIRVRTIIKNIDAQKAAFGLSYLGLFLMSQVNPGEFCPPYVLFAVLTFVVAEKYSSGNMAKTNKTANIERGVVA